LDVAEPVREAARLLEGGSIVAIKGLGGFHLACDARSEQAVSLLRERKHHIEKPFAVMLRRVEDADRCCELDDSARKLLVSIERPMVLLARKPGAHFPLGIAPGNRYVGLYLPYTPLQHLLFASGKFEALVMTSANLSEEPIAIDNQEAVQRLRNIADAFLVHDRDIVRRCEDSVVRAIRGRTQQLRRSRGFVPVPVALEQECEPILAVGGELKNTVCIVRGAEAFLSQHIGDLENLESYRFFEEAVEHLQRILGVHPKTIAYDLHPDYFSTKWALAREGVALVGVQHHHAHIVACMAENHLDGKVIGMALDGTGYGLDGAIWGGEVLLADCADFERAAHLEYVPLPGGAAAIHEPWRTAISYLTKHYGNDLGGLDVPLLRSIDARKLSVVQQMIDRQIHSPRTSSCSSLFDAVAALAGVRSVVNYQAQAAIEFEMAGHDSTDAGGYPMDLVPDGKHWIIGTLPLFQCLLRDICGQQSLADISRRFHNGLACTFVQLAENIRQQSKLNRICLSGSCFENVLLSELLRDGLQKKSFEVYFHSQVPAGDGGISLGQALVAARRPKTL
jgi:hydrogenase maturation protein HypF